MKFMLLKACSELHRACYSKWSCCAAIMVLAQTILCVYNPTAAWSQTQWTRYNQNPVVDVGPAGAWDESEVHNLFVFFDGTKYHMWFTGDRSGFSAIGYASSPDGLRWTKHAGNPVLQSGDIGGWESDAVFRPVVIFDGTRFHMWYTGCINDNCATGYATSLDGINWTKHANNPVISPGASGSWDAAWVSATSVLFDGTTYKMWYQGSNGSVHRFGFAISSDGVQWTKYASNPILDRGVAGTWESVNLVHPDVTFDGKNYQMWYNGFDGSFIRIGHATSSDGINWVKNTANPILDRGAPGSWERRGVGNPRVIFDGQRYQMWYIGVNAQFLARIGYASSEISTAVTNRESNSITEFALLGNYPNPFNPSTTIRYALPQAGQVSLKILNLAGQEITTLIDGKQSVGEHQIQWQAQGVPSGVYFYQLRAGEHVETRKMILLR